MTESILPEEQKANQRRSIQTAIRIGLLALLIYLCFRIVEPFITTFVWGIIIAIASFTPYTKLTQALGGRSKLASSLFVVLGLLLLILPTIALGASLVETVQEFSQDFEGKPFAVPPPPTSVEDWPLVGKKLYELWLVASQNLEEALDRFTPQLKEVGLWLFSSMGHLSVGLFMFVLAIVIAGLLLPNAERGSDLARRVAILLTGQRGAELVSLCAASVRSVTRGILGVAMIQSLLSGLGMLLAGVPGAGLWTLLVLLVAIVQLPTLLVLVPVAIYVFSTSTTAVFVLFAIWTGIIGLSDNFLKPLLMGRGVDVPMLIIFLGAIGGFILEGIIGLFVGAVVLAVGYTLFKAWFTEAEEARRLATETAAEAGATAAPAPRIDSNAPTKIA